MFDDIEYKALKAYLVDGWSQRKIEREILGLDAPLNGGGYVAMKLLHKYNIREEHKSILMNSHLSKEELIKYLNDINAEHSSSVEDSKNKVSNEFLKKQLSKNNIEYKSLKNSFYEINIDNNKYLLKCRTYNKNYTFVTKSEIPELSDNILIALVEWQNEQPVSLYLIPTSEWTSGKWNMLKDRDYEGLKSEPEWGIDINQSNKYELNNFRFSKFINTLIILHKLKSFLHCFYVKINFYRSVKIVLVKADFAMKFTVR